jgi:hypothetical protein
MSSSKKYPFNELGQFEKIRILVVSGTLFVHNNFG